MPSPNRVSPLVARLASLAIVAAVALVAVAVGVRTSPATSPEPSAPQATDVALASTPPAGPTDGPTLDQPTPDATAAATPSPIATPPSTPTPTPIPSPTEPQQQTGIWRRVEGLMSPAAHVTSVVAGGPGFVAVGYHGDDSYPCQELTVDGRAWTSTDGGQWTEWLPDALEGLVLTRVVNAAGTLYAFGMVGDEDCATHYVPAAVRSTDGMSWERFEPEFPGGYSMDALGAIDGTLIGLGADSSWTSVDGQVWLRGGDVPFSYSWFEEIASLGHTGVALDGNGARPAWFSGDTGSTWRQSEFQPVHGPHFIDSTVGSDLIVVVGDVCCSLPNTGAGVSLTSTDGMTWHESARFRDIPQAVVTIADGYMAVGRSNWVSRDGLDWRVGPQLPDFDRRSEVLATSAAAGVLVINGDYAWFARSDALDAADWVEDPRESEMPEIGIRYPTDVFLHCGWRPIHFGFQTWMPDPPFIDNANPPPGFGDLDHGWLTQRGKNELLYESRRGPTVTLRPGQAPAFEGPCA